jgi:hypothetical protein
MEVGVKGGMTEANISSRMQRFIKVLRASGIDPVEP